MMDCKKALTEADGDVEKAIEILRVKQGKAIQDRGEREATEGTVQTYIHAGAKVGVLVEVDCKTDFVARNDDFVEFARDVALQIAATPTVSTSAARTCPPRSATPRRGSASRRRPTSPRTSASKIVAGQARQVARDDRAARAGACNNDKYDGKTVQQLRDELAATTGENVVIRRFARFAVGG